MGGVVEELNPVKGLRKIGNYAYEYRLSIEGKHEDTELSFDVVGFPTMGEYHIKFTNATGMDSTPLKDWLKYERLIFKTDTIEMNMDNGTVSILLSESDSNYSYYLENIKAVIRMPREEIKVTEEDIMNNEIYKKAMMPIIKSQYKQNNPKSKGMGLFAILKSIFQIK